MNQQADLLPEPEKKISKVRYRIVSGDAGGLRGVVELEAASYSVTAEGTLVIYGENTKLAEYAAGAWRSIVSCEAFSAALKGGTGDELPRKARAVT
jgi:hypothetical protein